MSEYDDSPSPRLTGQNVGPVRVNLKCLKKMTGKPDNFIIPSKGLIFKSKFKIIFNAILTLWFLSYTIDD
jgi:hypothetical protein